MSHNEVVTEKMIQDRSLNAPRLTPGMIDAAIRGETYTKLPSGKKMICELTLQNGFTVIGEASCVRPENFNEEIGQRVSRANAREKIWLLEGYALQTKFPA